MKRISSSIRVKKNNDSVPTNKSITNQYAEENKFKGNQLMNFRKHQSQISTYACFKLAKNFVFITRS